MKQAEAFLTYLAWLFLSGGSFIKVPQSCDNPVADGPVFGVKGWAER